MVQGSSRSQLSGTVCCKKTFPSPNYVLLSGNACALVPRYRGVFCSLSPSRSPLSTVATLFTAMRLLSEKQNVLLHESHFSGR